MFLPTAGRAVLGFGLFGPRAARCAAKASSMAFFRQPVAASALLLVEKIDRVLASEAAHWFEPFNYPVKSPSPEPIALHESPEMLPVDLRPPCGFRDATGIAQHARDVLDLEPAEHFRSYLAKAPIVTG